MLRAPSGHMTLSGAVWYVNYTIQVFCRADCRLYNSVCVVQIKASLALQIEARPAGNKLHLADVSHRVRLYQSDV